MKKYNSFVLLFLLSFYWYGNAQFVEDFEGTFPPSGWTTIDNGDVNSWYKSVPETEMAHSPVNVARINFSNSAHDDWLVSKAIFVTAFNTDRYSFWAKNRSLTFAESFNVKLSTNTNGKADFTEKLEVLAVPSNSWTKYTYDLSDYLGETVYIAIQAVSTNKWELFIDDVVNDGLPTCTAPTNVGVNSITQTTATIAWLDGVGCSTVSTITVFPAISGAPFTVNCGVENIPLTGLAPNTTYTVEVANDCGANLSESITFITPFVPLSNPSPCGISRIIPDSNCTPANEYIINVATAPGFILGDDVYLKKVKILISHTFDGELDIKLQSPNGVTVDLSSNNGGSGNNYGNPSDNTCEMFTEFNMTGVDGSITSGTAPFIGSFAPEGNFADFEDASSPIGNWILKICDNAGGDLGTLEFVELEFGIPPVCDSPAALNTSAITHNSVNINWLDGIGCTNANTVTVTPAITGSPFTVNCGVETIALVGLIPETFYTINVANDCNINPSSTLNFTTLVSPPNYCAGDHFYDSGGLNNNYSDIENSTTTIFPDNSGDVVTVTFNSFNTENGFDRLFIYDGLDSSAPIFSSGATNGAWTGRTGIDTFIPQTFTSTHSSGALTFVFISDGGVNYSGWDATITCGLPPNCIPPSAMVASNISSTGADLNWTINGSELQWDLEIGLAGFTPTGVPTNNDVSNSFNFTTGLSNTSYDVYYRADCGANNIDVSTWVGLYRFTTLEEIPDYCGGDHFYDSGGLNNNYSNGENTTRTIFPDNPGDVVTVTFNSFNTENGFDRMFIYDGPDFRAPIFSSGATNGAWTGRTGIDTFIPHTFTSTHPSGAITFIFISDGGVNYSGWDATITCTPSPICTSPSAMIATNITTTTADLDWTIGSTETLWDLEIGLSGFTPTGIPTNNDVVKPFTFTGIPNTEYDVYYRADCGGDNINVSQWVGLYRFKTLEVILNDYCGGDHFYDSGGLINNYSDGENSTTTIFPDNPGDVITVTFNSFNTEPSFDGLMIYDGPDETYPLFDSGSTFNRVTCPNGAWTGRTDVNDPFVPNASFTSTHPSGSLTFVFTTDGGVNYSGWDVTVICTPPNCTKPTSLAVNAITQNTANLTWSDGIGCTTAKTITVTPAITGSPFTVNCGVESILLTGLTAGTIYNVEVTNDCGINLSAAINFTSSFIPLTNPSTCGLSRLIPDNSCTSENQFEIDVTTAPGNTLGTDVILKNVRLVIEHTFDEDLDIKLISPSGISVELSSDNGSSLNNYGDPADLTCSTYTEFSMTGVDGLITTAIAPFIGTFIPEGNFTDFEDASSPIGIWTLEICDDKNIGTGTLEYVELIFDSPPVCAAPTLLTTSAITHNEATINWSDGVGCSTVKTVTVTPTIAGSPFVVNCGVETISLSSLVANTAYTIEITNDCGFNPSSVIQFTTLFQPPANNDFLNAELLTVNSACSTTLGTLVGATSSGEIPFATCGNTNGTEADVWYKFSAVSNGNMEIGTDIGTGNDLDTVMTLYSYDGTNLTEIQCNNDNALNPPFSKISITDSSLIDGNTYYIRIHEFDGDNTDDFNICIYNLPCPSPLNMISTNFTTTSVDLNWNAGVNNETEWEIVYDISPYAQPINGIIDATNEPNYINVSSTPSILLTGLTAETSYNLYYRSHCSGANFSNWVAFNFATAPINDLCTNAIDIFCGNIYSGSTNNATETDEEIEFCGTVQDAPGVWYRFVGDGSNIRLNLCGSNYDTKIQVWEGSCGVGTLNCIGGNDDNSTGTACAINLNQSEFTFASLLGLEYYIYVYGANSTTGNYELNVTCVDCVGNTTIWNGSSWSNGEPTINKPVKIIGAYDTAINGDLTCCDLEVTSTGSIIVQAEDFINVNGNIVNEGTITVLNTGSVVQENNLAVATGTGIFTTEIITTNLEDGDRFTYFGTPSKTQDSSIFSWSSEMWEFNENVQFWNYLGDGTYLENLIPAKGYAIRANAATTPEIQTMQFKGAFNNGIYTQPLVKDIGTHEPTVLDGDDDATLIGNPYPSGINLLGTNGLFDVNPNLGQVFVWTHASLLGASDFVDNDYIICSAGGCNTNKGVTILNGVIASGQGFFVDALNNDTLIINNAMRSTLGNTQFRDTDSEDKIWLTLTSEIGYSSSILVNFSSNGSVNFDAQFDARQLYNTNYGMSYYAINATKDKLAIEDIGLFNTDITIPLGFIINDENINQLKLSIEDYKNLEGVSIYVRDNLIGTTYDLKLEDYIFNTNSIGEFNDRLELIFKRESLSNDNTIINTILITQNENQLNVNLLEDNRIIDFKIYDVLGKLLVKMQPNENNFIVHTNFIQNQVLFIKSTLNNGKVLTTKLYYK